MPLTKRIIPCLDVDQGRVVKGIQFVDLVDAGDPLEQAHVYNKEGADELVFLDITATHEGRDIMHDVVRQTAEQIFIPLTVGGGIRTLEDMRKMLHAGADKVAINSAAIRTPDLITECAEAFGAQCVVVAIDMKRRPQGGWEVYTHGGRRATGIDGLEWAKEAETRGAGELLVTSMDRDGTQIGYDLELLQRLDKLVQLPVIASGGAGTLEHLRDALLVGRAHAVLAASMFHFKQVTIMQAKQFLHDAGITVRLI
ncbi:MAG: imidazole glycerol phosphate synthase subunit HisF [Rhodothermaceae bacterium]|nr:imidazole glycerol phosphate synthase subunit HisF [Rhodothermaceae bacterium]MYG69087.1 imidazole glycerol phosphate synthase subunit HisF [Rhodothermaceae bacterium]MYJ44813.1 imidazole glycerol phosphate synthase subunit HisF [Rhodothermaceae bacterium]